MKQSLITCLLFCSYFIQAQSALQYSVRLEVEVDAAAPSITLHWDEDANASQFIVYRKTIDVESWGAPLTSTTALSYTDTDVQTGVRYDYRVVKGASGYNGIGYVRSGIRIELETDRGNALLLVEDSIATALSSELAQVTLDLEGEGYNTRMITVPADTTVAYVKDLILDHDGAVEALEMLYIIGHVPVPYSGNLAPDGHVPDHLGAWPADVYYADLDGTWPDNSVNTTGASDPRNDNVPNDGKFDVSALSNDEVPELMIGRVDFANLSHFNESEVELTRAYLNRVHAYKMGEWSLEKRALIDDNFGGFGGEAFASNGWRNFAPLIGKDQITTSDYRTTMASESYLFSYGCGGGSHESASGIGSSSQLSGDSLLTGFTMLFGSYFGDWDRPNNFMRSALAQGRTMSISWAGRPWWYYHPMGLGESLGACARLTQSNSGTFQTSYGGRFVHIAQLGDPSLRMEYIKGPTQLIADSVDTYHTSLQWTASADTSVVGYRVFRRFNGGEWTVLHALHTETSYVDSCVLDAGTYAYRVSAISLSETPSGTFWNQSIGVIDSVEVQDSKHPTLTYLYAEQSGFNASTIDYEAEVEWSEGIIWLFPDTTVENAYSFSAPLTATGTTNPPYNDGVDYKVIVYNECSSDTTSAFANAPIGGLNERGLTDFTVFPNPVKQGGSLRIEVTGSLGYAIYDVRGRIVAEGATQEGRVAIFTMEPGVYYLTLDDHEGAAPFVVVP